MQLQDILPIFKFVLHGDRLAWELAELSHWDEAESERVRNRCAEDESARLDPNNDVGLLRADRDKHCLNRSVERLSILEECGDVAEDDPWLRKVRDRADL